MIQSISSSLVSFRTVRFHSGLNVLLSETIERENRKITRNSVGKTSLIEVVHFILGADCNPDSIFRRKELIEHYFRAEITISGSLCTLERTGSEPSRVYLIEGFERENQTPIKLEKDTQRNYMSNNDWRDFLGRKLFSLPGFKEGSSTDSEFYVPSFRSMVSYFARRDASGGFSFPERHATMQQRWDWQGTLSYLLDLDYQIPNEFKKIQDKEASLKELKKVAKGNTLREIFGTVAELRTKLTVSEDSVKKLGDQLANFQVHESYNELSEKAVAAKNEMQSLLSESIVLKEALSHLNLALAEETSPNNADIEGLYKSINVELPGVAVKRLSEVAAFYSSIVENRKHHLSREIEDIEARILHNDAGIKQLDQTRKDILMTLRGRGALDDFVALQSQFSELKANTAYLREQFRAAEILQSSTTQIRIERQKLYNRLQLDFKNRKKVLERSILRVSEYISELYDDRSGSFEIVATDRGPKFNITIEGDSGGGIRSMEIFCFDFALFTLNAEKGRCPRFLIHDSHLFEGVDERQIAKSLELGAKVANQFQLQYIVTMNSDVFDRLPFSQQIEKNEIVLSTILSDRDEKGGLFGIRFE